MASIFVSYSRADGEFAQKLVAALESAQHKVWIDNKPDAIRVSDDWWTAIQKGVREADVFVFVLSQSSAGRPMCHLEVNEARKNKKKIVTAVIGPFKALKYGEMIGSLADSEKDATVVKRLDNQDLLTIARDNWAFLSDAQGAEFIEPEQYDERYTRVLAAIETDLAEATYHTRLQIRASEWIAAGRKASLALRGDELSRAERWLVETEHTIRTSGHGARISAATAEQIDYINGSRAAQAAQQRSLIGALLVGIVVLLVFALVAVWQAVLSNQNAQRADNNAGTAVANAATATVAQGEALNNAVTATIAEGEALHNAATATIAQGQALNSANTAVANAATATNAQGQALVALRESERQRLAAAAQHAPGAELKTLLAIRSLGLGYSPEADRELNVGMSSLNTLARLDSFKESVYEALFSPDGKWLVTVGLDQTIQVWDVKTWRVDHNIERSTQTRINLGTLGVAFSPDSQFVLTANGDLTAQLNRLDTGKLLRTFSTGIDFVSFPRTAAAFSPDGKYVLIGGANRVIMFSAATGQQIQEFKGHTDWINDATFSPDGKQIATASQDGTVQLWDTALGTSLKTLKGHTGAVRSVTFSPDGTELLSGGVDSSIRRWKVATGEEIRRIDYSAAINTVTYSPDGKLILAGTDQDSSAILWDSQTGKQIHLFADHNASVNSARFSPDGKQVATASSDKTVRIWSVAPTGSGVFSPDHGSLLSNLAFSADGQSILVGDQNNTVWQWSPVTNQIIRTFEGSTSIFDDSPGILAVNFSSDNRQIITGGSDFVVRLWDVATGKQTHWFSDNNSLISSVALSPDGRYAVSGDWENEATLWDVTTGVVLTRFPVATNGVDSVAFSPDGRSLLTGGGDHYARLWDLQTGTEIRRFEGHTDNVWKAVFSPDGRFIATASFDHTVRLWDAQTGKELRQFPGHADRVREIAFSPDGKYLATAADKLDKTVRLFDVSTGALLRQFVGHTDGLFGVAFSPDGQRIASSGRDGTVRVWYVAVKDSITQACKQLLRDLSESERILYRIDASATCSPVVNGLSATGTLTAIAPASSTLSPTTAATPTRMPTIVYATRTAAPTPTAPPTLINPPAVLAMKVNSDQIADVAFTPDGRYALTAGTDGKLRIWDAATGISIRDLAPTNNLSSVAVSPDGRRLLLGGFLNGTFEYDLNSGELLRTIGYKLGLSGGPARYNPDGSEMMVASLFSHSIQFFDTNSGVALSAVTVSKGLTGDLRYSSMGVYFAFLQTNAKEITVYRTKDRKPVQTFKPATSPLRFTFVPGQPQILITDDLGATLYDIETGAIVRHFDDKQLEFAYAYSPDGRLIAASDFLYLNVFDAQSGKQTLRIKKKEGSLINALAFSPDSGSILTGDLGGGIYLYRLAAAQPFTTLTETVTPTPTITPTLSPLAVPLQTFKGHSGVISSVAVAPDGKQLLTGGKDATVRLWAMDSGKEIKQFFGAKDDVRSVAFWPDGKQIGFTTGEFLSVGIVLNTETGTERFRFGGIQSDAGYVSHFSFSPDGQTIVSSGTHAALWDSQTGQLIFSLPQNIGSILAATYSADGKLLFIPTVANDPDKNVLVWDIAAKQLVPNFISTKYIVEFVIPSSDGRHLLAGDDLFDLTTKTSRSLTTGSGFYNAGAISPDGKLAAIGTNLGQVGIYQVESGALLKMFTAHQGGIDAMAFTPDSQQLVTAGDDGVARLWAVNG